MADGFQPGLLQTQQPPSYLGAPLQQYPDVGGNMTQTLDSMMNNAIRNRLGAQQLQAGKLELQNAQIAQNQNLSPFGVSPQTAADPNSWQQAFQPQMNGEDPQITGLRQMQAAQLLAIQQQVAQTQAQTQSAQAAATAAQYQNTLMGAPSQPGQPQAGGPNMFEENINAIKNGTSSPDLLAQSMSRAPEWMKVGQAHAIAQHLQAGDLDMTKAQNEYDAKNKGAVAQAEVQKGQGQTLGSLAGTLEDVLNQAQPLIGNLNPTQVKLLNSAWTKGLASVNDPNANQVLAYMNEAKGLYASVLSNGSAAQDADKKMAEESIGRGLNPASFAAVKNAITFAAQSKVKRLQGQGFQEPSQATTAITRTLKNGQQVKVIPLGNGQFQAVQ